MQGAGDPSTSYKQAATNDGQSGDEAGQPELQTLDHLDPDQVAALQNVEGDEDQDDFDEDVGGEGEDVSMSQDEETEHDESEPADQDEDLSVSETAEEMAYRAQALLHQQEAERAEREAYEREQEVCLSSLLAIVLCIR